MPSDPAPPPPAAPPQPNFAAATREGVQAEVDMLPLKYQTELEYQPKFQDMSIAGEAKSADARAQTALDIARKYGGDFTESSLRLSEQADPVGTAIRKELGERVLSNLKLGTDMDPQLAHDVKQAYRAGRSVRGGGLGDEDAVLEAMTMGEAGLKMQEQRFADAGSFLSGKAPQPVNAPYMPSAPAPVLDPTTPKLATAFAQGNYSDQLRYNDAMYGHEVDWGLNAPNPWMEGLGIAAGMVGSVGGSAAGAALI